MKAIAWVVAGVAAIGLSLPAQAQHTMKECAAQWNQMKAANQTGGVKYRDFQKQCMSKSDAGTAAPATTTTAAKPAPAPTPAAPAATTSTTTTTKPVSAGRQAVIDRERACAAEWKADKAAGKTNGLTWPKYWSACNARKKAQGT